MSGNFEYHEHLEEVRIRIIYYLIFLSLFSLLSYFSKKYIISFLQKIVDINLVVISPSESFLTVLKISTYIGFLLSIPVLVYQILVFLFPAIEKKFKMFSIAIAIISICLFYLGVTFSIFFVIPFSFNFLLNFISSDVIKPMITFSNYTSFIIRFSIVFGIIFQEPLIIIMLIKTKLVSISKLSKLRPYFIIINLVFAAVITPPDVVSQLILALPLIVFYEFSIILSKLFFINKK